MNTKQLNFVEEASVYVNEFGKVKIVGPVGTEHYGVYSFPRNGKVRSVILLTSLSDPRGELYYEFVEGTTTARTFRNFLARAVQAGWIGTNDKVIMDNAKVHHGQDVLPEIDMLLNLAGARRVNLPAYSPELNPCEFVFGEMKRYLRTHASNGRFTALRIHEALQRIPKEHIIATYLHCTSVAFRE
jgi:transposase